MPERAVAVLVIAGIGILIVVVIMVIASNTACGRLGFGVLEKGVKRLSRIWEFLGKRAGWLRNDCHVRAMREPETLNPKPKT